jgi:hypothetical protein
VCCAQVGGSKQRNNQAMSSARWVNALRMTRFIDRVNANLVRHKA